MIDETQTPVNEEEYEEDGELLQIERPLPIGLVVARILIVSAMGIAAALAIFFLIGAIWLMGVIALAATVVFMGMMFAIERFAE